MTLKQQHVLTTLSKIYYQAEKRNKQTTSWANFKRCTQLTILNSPSLGIYVLHYVDKPL